jgi:nitroreductase
MIDIRDYHQRSKHALQRYAAGPGHLDWSSQPDPFRRFAGCERISLPLAADGLRTAYRDLFSPGVVSAAPLDPAGVGTLLELSLGLSAWKQAGGDRWALRCNPSSGNLHPTECYVAVSGVAGLPDGVHHYLSHDHVLERRCTAVLPARGLLVGLSSVHWREAWKYGERAWRYCQHDAGHALAALRYAAGALGWRVRLLDHWSDAQIAALLGLEREEDFAGAEGEHPDLLCVVDTAPASSAGLGAGDPASLVEAARRASWRGRANRLSAVHAHDWPVIEEAAHAAAKPPTSAVAPFRSEAPSLPPALGEDTAAELIRRRRSAQAFDGVTAIPAQTFFRLLDATLPRSDLPPFDAWPWAPWVHLAVFVHRVAGLAAGLYFLARSPEGEALARRAFRAEFDWQAVDGAPVHLRLYRLLSADCRRAARTLSCHQDIAADGAFSLGMLAGFDGALEEGPWVYRQLYWECGIIGQALYLEAEACGVRGTGIGCFFDDAVHEVLGIADTTWQSLYHFTVGSPVADRRLQTLPPYAHLHRAGGEE